MKILSFTLVPLLNYVRRTPLHWAAYFTEHDIRYYSKLKLPPKSLSINQRLSLSTGGTFAAGLEKLGRKGSTVGIAGTNDNWVRRILYLKYSVKFKNHHKNSCLPAKSKNPKPPKLLVSSPRPSKSSMYDLSYI